jgi:hypothetical protein
MLWCWVSGRGNYISGELYAWKNLATRRVVLSAEMGEKPEEERKCEAEDEAGDDGEIEGGVFAAVDDVAGKFAEAEGKFATEIEKSAKDDKKAAEKEQSAAEFTEGVHRLSLEEPREVKEVDEVKEVKELAARDRWRES